MDGREAPSEASATHQEILKGIGGTPEDRRHVFAFFRSTKEGDEDTELRDLKASLRVQLGENVFEYAAGDFGKLCRDVVQRPLLLRKMSKNVRRLERAVLVVTPYKSLEINKLG